jgi:hypothetical protein
MSKETEQQCSSPSRQDGHGDPHAPRNAGWSVADIKSAGGTKPADGGR